MSADDWDPRSRWGLSDLHVAATEQRIKGALDRIERIADLRREIASPRPAHLSEAFHATHIAAAQASLERLLDDTDTDIEGSDHATT